MGTSLNVHNLTKCVPLVAAVAVSSPLLARIPTSRLFGNGGREGGRVRGEEERREGKGRGRGGKVIMTVCCRSVHWFSLHSYTPIYSGEACVQGGAVFLLERVKPAAIHQPSYHLQHRPLPTLHL